MRSFEFVDGGSAKFWEIHQHGSDVTVRWGRVGTTGQTKVKTFADVEAAAAHESRLVAEKLRKGYAEIVAAPSTATVAVSAPESSAATVAVSAPESSAAPTLPDEDTFVFPAAWHRYRHARRGSTGATRFAPHENARKSVDAQIDRRSSQVTRILEAPTTDRAVTRAGLAWLAGSPDAPPVGAAAVVVAARLNGFGAGGLAEFADVWIAEHGLRFAAEAAVEAMALIDIDDHAPPGPAGSRTADTYGIRHRRPGECGYRWNFLSPMAIVMRVRSALAVASDTEYADVLAALTPYRSAGAYFRAATSALVPTQREWVEQDVASAVADSDGDRAMLLLTAAGSGAQAQALTSVIRHAYWVARSLEMLTTIVDGVGVDAAPVLFGWFDQQRFGADIRRRLLSVLSVLPADEAVRGFVRRLDVKYVAPVLLEVAGRYPVRAMRMLAEGASSTAAAELLRTHVLAHPEAVDRAVANLGLDSARRVEAICAAAGATVRAPLSAVPPLLVDPPWQQRKRSLPPVVVGGLSCSDPASISWVDGERDTWRGRVTSSYPQFLWERIAERVATNKESSNERALFFGEAPEELALPLLATWRARETWGAATWTRIIAARFELHALPAMLDLARRSPVEVGETLLPYAAPAIAELMAGWYARLKSVRRTALRWLLRHPAEAARALVPSALGKAGTSRRQAEQALLAMYSNGCGDAVRAAAQQYGAAAVAGIEVLLATDPLSLPPAKLPPVPGWVTPGLLPPVLLHGGAGALPDEAVTNLVTVLALCRPDDPYAGVDVVKEACDPASLAEFGWGLFQRWIAHGASSKEGWVLDALGLIGDDETVRRLTPLILAWPGEGGHARAVTGVHVLAAIGTDVALMHLHGIAQRAKFRGLKAAAGQKMDDVAAALGLSADQLADRLVPDFGLDAEGSLRLDYGPRRFTVGFDEQLRPYVSDGAGKRLKALPKPGVRDDVELAPAAYKHFAALKKDVRTVAADQIRRLERAMVTGRRWTGAELRELFVAHPLLWHLARRLVWGRYDDAGALVGGIRVAEDRTFSTVDDEETQLPDDATVGVAHPLHLGETVPDWAEVFADDEILQPFPQLSRQTFTLTEDEVTAGRLTRFEGLTAPTGKVIGLERRGWQRGEPQDAGIQECIALTIGPKQTVTVDLDPGFDIGNLESLPEQKLEAIYLHDGTGGRWNGARGRAPIGGLGPIAVSEIIRDLTEVTS